MQTPLQQPSLHPVAFVGSGPGDPDLLTLKALRALQTADVVIHDRLVSAEILSLVGPQTRLRNAGKEGFGPSVTQDMINTMIIEEARQGARVVRLKSGDPTVFGRLDEELDALTDAGLDFTIVPGLTSASAAVAALGQSLTKRGRNTAVRFVTGHDMQGYADHDWRDLAAAGEVAAIYMGKKAARFIQGRLLMHGAQPGTPVTIVENASRPDQRIVEATLATLPQRLAGADITGPALLMYGLAPRSAEAALPAAQEMI
ncbi:uroporphyrinogen-III C-methyltransferase [Marivita sp. S6314]|uniref:uroporphyrinogen-III C-methyltransferase n=1 Tax=Marivita sp. S6314 TaxID=2926406 RepID=UPI001FF270D9|nr:uroporphyrinogen-III C-methyltransferase [Marivita sp. S6314]MCK0148716.1 uroporphyrinogen-III C-methyltransferase [Marivita sp. S6314]